MIWTQPVRVRVLAFPWKFWLAIISGEDSVVPALVGNSQLVEDANRPHDWWYDHTKRGVTLSNMILGFPSIVGNARYLAQCARSPHHLCTSWDFLAFTIWLTNMYLEWAIKLFEIYKKSMMMIKVCWMCYKSDGKFIIEYFIVYLKIKLLNYV